MERPDETSGRKVVYSPVIRLRNGRILHAKAYGIKAWRFEVPVKKQPD